MLINNNTGVALTSRDLQDFHPAELRYVYVLDGSNATRNKLVELRNLPFDLPEIQRRQIPHPLDARYGEVPADILAFAATVEVPELVDLSWIVLDTDSNRVIKVPEFSADYDTVVVQLYNFGVERLPMTATNLMKFIDNIRKRYHSAREELMNTYGLEVDPLTTKFKQDNVIAMSLVIEEDLQKLTWVENHLKRLNNKNPKIASADAVERVRKAYK